MYKCESPWIKLPLFLSFLPFVHHFSFCWPTKLFCKKCYGRVHVSRCEIKIFFSPKSSLLFWCFFFSSILLVVHRCNKLLIVLKILVEGFFFFPLLPALSLLHWVPCHCFLSVYLIGCCFFWCVFISFMWQAFLKYVVILYCPFSLRVKNKCFIWNTVSMDRDLIAGFYLR